MRLKRVFKKNVNGLRNGSSGGLLARCGLAGAMAGIFLTPAQAAVLVHDFYLPLPEAQIRQTFTAIENNIGTRIDSVFSVVVTGEGTQIYFDHWEDGYEINLANPLQSSTEIWGDGDNGNGIAPGFANDPAGLDSGAVLSLRNYVDLPRNPSNILYDGRDRMAATKALVVSRAGWATTPGPVLSGAVEVSATIDYGTSYVSPVGEDLSNNYFQYVGFSIMASEDNTQVTIDADGPGGSAAITATLGRGDSHLVNGGVLTGGTIDSTKPIQVQLVIGRIGGRYATDWFTLVPFDDWSGSYYTPVGTASDGNATINYFYNPGSTNISIQYLTQAGSGSFTVPAGGVSPFQMPQNSGARFTSAGNAPFFALAKAGARSGGESAYDWGFTLLPADGLTSEAVVGWGPGSSDGSRNGSPVWLTAVEASRVYVDFNGDHTGIETDPNGNDYDVHFDVSALESLIIYDPDGDQTAMRLYTVDGTAITAAWGEDPAAASPGNPYFDFGTTVLPFPTPVIRKTSRLYLDNGVTGLSVGDVVEYTVDLDNRGLLPLGNTVVIDDLPTNLISYVTNSTYYDGNLIADDAFGTAFPLDDPGYTIPVILRNGSSTFSFLVSVDTPGAITNVVQAAGYSLSASSVVTPPPGGGTTQSVMDFTDNAGTPVGFYSSGDSVYLTLTDADGNTDSGSVETKTVTVENTDSGDSETITLTETGAASGIFRNIVGLPSSDIAGLADQDGTLNVAPGDSLSASYVDPLYGDSDTAAAIIQVPSLTKVLYLSDTAELDRIDPVASGDSSTASTADLVAPASGTIVAGSATAKIETGSNSSSFSHNSGTDANRLLLVSVSIQDDTGGAVVGGVSSITYGGQSLSQVASAMSLYEAGVELWMLTNAPGGANTVNVSMTDLDGGTDVAIINALTLSGVDLTNPLSQTNSASNRGLSGSVSITSSTEEQVFGVLAFDNSRDLYTGPSDVWDEQTGDGNNGVHTAATLQTGAASVNLAWTWDGWGGSFLPGWGAIAVSVRPAPGGTGGSTSFTQTPAFGSPFSMPAGSVISVTNYINVTSGSMPGAPAVTATLTHGTNTVLQMTSPSYSGGMLIWNGVLPSMVAIPSGDALTLDVENNEAGVSFEIEYDSSSKPSRIGLPTTTVITVDSLAVYDAPYPGGNVMASAAAGSELYVRATVSDPFGAYDITGVDLTIDGPSTSNDIAVALTDSDVLASNSISKVYEYAWQTGPDPLAFSLSAMAHEGSEGITATAAAGISLIFLDLGTPGTVTFTDGDDGPATNSFPADGTVYLRVSDADQNTDPGVGETVTVVIVSGGDSETNTLTETGLDTGLFTGSIASSTTGGTAGDGTLNAAAGAVITATYTDPDDAGDTAFVTGTISSPPGIPGLTVNKSLVLPADGNAALGDVVRYAIQVINSGSTVLTGISLDDTYPASNLTYLAASVIPDSVTNGIISWTGLGSLNPGENLSVTVDFTATGLGTSVTNSASSSAAGGATGGSSVPLNITQPGLDVSVSLISPASGPVAIGSQATFRIAVTNSGSTAIPTLPLENLFSGSLYEFVSATVTPDGAGAGSLLWNDITGAGSLTSGSGITIDVTLRVVGLANPAETTARVEFAVDEFDKPVPVATGTGGVETQAALLSGHVYNDADESGTLTVGDTGLEGVAIQLFSDPNSDGDPGDGTEIRVTATDVSGAFELPNLELGDYVIVQSDLPGYASSAPADNRIAVSLVSLAASTNHNFFDYLPAPTNYASISGTVWLDANSNGVVNAGETGIVNVAVDLVQDANTNGLAEAGEPTVASAFTDGAGAYLFSGVVSGSYVVVQTDLFGHLSTGDAVPPNDNQVGVSVTNSQVSVGNDFLDFFTGNTPGNDVPVAVPDSYSVDEDLTMFVLPSGVLTNDVDVDGDSLSVVQLSSTTNGLLSLNSDGGFLYNPSTNFFGSDSFSYAATDGMLTSAPVTVSLTVTPVNDIPVTVADGATTGEDSAVMVSVLTNDSDDDGDALTLTGVTSTNGFATISGTNVVYTPATNFSGTSILYYYATDGTDTSTGQVTITVNPINDPPVVLNNTATTGEDTAVQIGVLGNDSDADGDTLSLLGADATNGTAVVSGTNVVYTPATNFFGLSVVSYYMTDGSVSRTGQVAVTVTPVNDAPVAANDLASTDEDTPVQIAVLGNDSDPEGSGLSLLGADATNGVAVISGTNVVYTPPTNYFGPSLVYYYVTDGSASSTGQVSITVNAGNDAPTTVDDSATTDEDTPVTISVLSNDSDSDGDSLTLSGTLASNGVAAVSGTNVVFTPATNYFGTNVFHYYVSDGTDSSTGQVTVIVNPMNDVPVAVDDSASTPEDTPVSINVLINDSDGDGDPLTLTGVFSTNGLSSVSGTNVVYTPATNFFGTNMLFYYVSDGTETSTGQVSVIVNSVNDAPTAAGDSSSTLQNTEVTIPVLGNDSDADGDPLTLTGVFSTNGTAVISGTNVVFNPATGYVGNATISYYVSDGSVTSTGMVSVAVTESSDLRMFLSGPTNGVVGLPMTFVLTVDNAGPSVASNIVVQKQLPTNLVFGITSEYGVATNNTVSWPLLSSLASGASTNFTVTVTVPNPGTFTNRALASSSTFDPDPSNNDSSSGISRLTVQVVAADYSLLEGPIGLNPQNGLFEQQVTVTNTMIAAAPAFRLFVDGLRPGVTLNNATGSTNGVPYVQVNTPLNPGEFTGVYLEYVVPDRQPFTNSLSVVWTLSEDATADPTGAVPVNTSFMDTQNPSAPRFVIEFDTIPGEIYTVLYTENLTAPWRAALPPVVAGSTRTQWYDDGPPKTQTHPRDTTNRYYRVIQED